MATHIASFAVILITWIFGITYYLDVADLARQDKIVVEVLLVFLTIVLVFRTVLTIRDFIRFQRNENHGEDSESIAEFFTTIVHSKRALFLAATAIYIALFQYIGFFVSSFTYVLVLNILLGTRGKYKLIGIPLALCLATFLLFVVALGIRLPHGFLI